MQINEFKLFLEVAEIGSLTKVAARRNTAQSHISRQITALEQSCGGILFRRTGRGVVLTEFGHHVATQARIWIKNSEALLADIQHSAKVPMGEVRVGILPSAAHPLMTEVFRRLYAHYPKIRLNVREGQGGELDALLDTGSVDMAILFRYQKTTSPDEVLLSTANTFLVSRPGMALTEAETVDFKQLHAIPLVLPRPPSHWRNLLDETARSKGIHLAAVVEADSLRLQREIILNHPNLYALLGPFSVHDALQAGQLKAAKVVSPELKRYVTLAHSRHGHFTQAGRIVSNLIKEICQYWNGDLNAPIGQTPITRSQNI
jgi:LysR family transcriptional regulator, nitrogen assimilation regulatory protein